METPKGHGCCPIGNEICLNQNGNKDFLHSHLPACDSTLKSLFCFVSFHIGGMFHSDYYWTWSWKTQNCFKTILIAKLQQENGSVTHLSLVQFSYMIQNLAYWKISFCWNHIQYLNVNCSTITYMYSNVLACI